MAGVVKDSHQLTLKVMRLSKPALHTTSPLYIEPGDYIAESLTNIKKDANYSDTIALSEELVLPQTFGNIYLGERFVSYIRVNNDSEKAAADVGVRAELQTMSQRVTLSDSSNALQSVAPNQSLDYVISHEVKELGKHTLICTVTYTNPDGDKLFFRKSFKFLISNPLAVKTKVYNVEREVFLEAQVQNMIPMPMYLESIHFDPNPLFILNDLNQTINTSKSTGSSKSDEDAASLFGKATYIGPQDVRQYLYQMIPKPGEERNAQFASTVGKLDITWRTSMGEMGRLQTSQLPRKVIPQSDLTLVAVSMPPKIVVYQPFTMQCVLSNMSDRRMSLRLFAVKSKMQNVLVNGVSGQLLGEFAPNSSREIAIDLFPVSTGLHSVSGLRVTDLISGRSYDIENLKDVMVLRNVDR